MIEKNIVITGANSGIGKAATIQFAKAGYSVIMACRTIENSRQICEEIIAETGNNAIDLMVLDTSTVESIDTFCAAFNDKYEKLDILIHNAAYFNHGHPYKLSADGFELTFATNVFGPFLLSMKLREKLKKSDDPRILHAGSNIIKNFFNPGLRIDFDHLRAENTAKKSFSVYNSYRDSKMALLMLTMKLAEEFKNDGIKVNVLEINGAKMSKETLRKFKPRFRVIAMIQNLFFPTTEYMAGNYFEICTSERFKGISGKLFNHKLGIMQPAQNKPDFKAQFTQLFDNDVYPNYAHNQETNEKIWNLCMELTHNQGM
jgi:NAD(P)-dependent dehydrogenase (short-subunit alcohol dehydrogenase family)